MPEKLEHIGFYTLSDKRAAQASHESPLWRCELILTPACNFNCHYCRPIRDDYRMTLMFQEALDTIDQWVSQGLKNVRLSGGEPTLWPRLLDLVKYIKSKGVERIALSTNGSASISDYGKLVRAGVSDFSISLDACCSETGEMMMGPGTEVYFTRVAANIATLSRLTYVTVGVVVTPENVKELNMIITFADDLGVSDIRVISASQWNQPLDELVEVSPALLHKYPILRYRMANSMHVRGLRPTDHNRCPLSLDDMAVAGLKHFPCIIYMREHGDPIGEMGDIAVVREERRQWAETHDTHADPICSRNCLDVCVDYNNKHKELRD